MFCGKENPVCLVYPFLPWSLSCKCPSTPSPTHSGHRVCRQLEKKKKYTETWNHRPAYHPCALVPNVRLCEAQSPILKSKDNWTKWPQRTTVLSPSSKFWQRTQATFVSATTRRGAQENGKEGLVSHGAIRRSEGKTNLSTEWTSVLECHLGRSLGRDRLGPCDTWTSSCSFSTHRHLPLSA